MIRQLFTRRRIITMVILFLVGTAGSFVVEQIAPAEQSPPPIAAPAAPPVRGLPAEPAPQVRIEDTFGPFEPILVSRSTTTPDTHAPSILLLRGDSGTSASTQWTIPYDPAQWDEQGAYIISGVSPPEYGYALVRTTSGRIYIVKVEQPFLIENVEEYMFVVDTTGHLYTVTTARAAGMRTPLR